MLVRRLQHSKAIHCHKIKSSAQSSHAQLVLMFIIRWQPSLHAAGDNLSATYKHMGLHTEGGMWVCGMHNQTHINTHTLTQNSLFSSHLIYTQSISYKHLHSRRSKHCLIYCAHILGSSDRGRVVERSCVGTCVCTYRLVVVMFFSDAITRLFNNLTGQQISTNTSSNH